MGRGRICVSVRTAPGASVESRSVFEKGGKYEEIASKEKFNTFTFVKVNIFRFCCFNWDHLIGHSSG
jgi:hypothetical protein